MIVMKTRKPVIPFILLMMISVMLSGCFTVRKPEVITTGDSIYNYRYFYINPTEKVIVGSYNGSTEDTPASGRINTIDPSAIITNALIRRGFIRVNEVLPQHAAKTMIISYGAHQYHKSLIQDTAEATIQAVSASTQELIAQSTAEEAMSNSTDRLRLAIVKALEGLLAKK